MMLLTVVRQPGRIAALLVVAGIAWTCWLLAGAWSANGGPGFPLDDPWIHLQFAKNLHDFGSFSYFRDELATAGSTSPLYTFLLAAGFFLTTSEMVLSYGLGLFFFAAGAFFFYRLCLHLFPGRPWITLAGLALFLLEPRMQWAALSGMETTLFVAGMLASFYYYATARWTVLAISLGLLLWIRPEALLMMMTLGIGALIDHLRERPAAGRVTPGTLLRSLWIRFRKPLVIAASVALPYVLMNLSLSGTLLPNTVAAKLGYYAPEQNPFLADLARFLGGEHFIIVAPFALAGCPLAVRAAYTRRLATGFVIFLWCAALILIYGPKLPLLHQQGRYLIPVLPGILILALTAGDAALQWAERRWPHRAPAQMAVRAASGALVLVVGAQFILRDNSMAGEYAGSCRHIRDVQVATALWLRDQTPGDAVVATHDIGAIGYYAERRIVDMAGLVSPGFIPHLRQLDSLPPFLAQNRVTHLAVLRNWFEVVNVNPLFRRGQADDEIMEVFAFDPLRVHFVPPAAAQAVGHGLDYLRKGDLAHAGPILESAVNLDPLSSRAHLSLGLARQAVGQLKLAEESFRRAVGLQPDLWSAHIVLAQMEAEQGRPDDAIGRLRSIIAQQPGHATAYALLADMYMRWKRDSLAARDIRDEHLRHLQEERKD
jgi:tetratricopeptide (TPR) repeat protein